MAEAAETKEASGGKGGFIVALLLLAVIGAGAGAGFSLTLLNGASQGDHGKGQMADAGGAKPDASASKSGAVKAGQQPGKAADARPEAEVPKDQVVNLDPILVTLAGPQKSWARLELGVVIEAESKEDRTPLLKAVSEDMMSYLRTVPLIHVESAAGLEYVREDLDEIVRLRSRGRIRGVVMRSLVVE